MLHLSCDSINLRRMISQLCICIGFDWKLLNFNVHHKILMMKLFPKRPTFTFETLRVRAFRNNAKLFAQLLEVQDEISYDSSKSAVLWIFCYVHMYFKFLISNYKDLRIKNLIVYDSIVRYEKDSVDCRVFWHLLLWVVNLLTCYKNSECTNICNTHFFWVFCWELGHLYSIPMCIGNIASMLPPKLIS